MNESEANQLHWVVWSALVSLAAAVFAARPFMSHEDGYLWHALHVVGIGCVVAGFMLYIPWMGRRYFLAPAGNTIPWLRRFGFRFYSVGLIVAIMLGRLLDLL